MQTSTDNKTLYDRDYALWLDSQVLAIKERNLKALDWSNLLEEIEDMGRAEKRAISSYLARLLEHLLKIQYWEDERERNIQGWRTEIRAFRKGIRRYLKDSPSLKNYLVAIFDEELRDAISDMSEEFYIPKDAQITLEQALNPDFFLED